MESINNLTPNPQIKKNEPVYENITNIKKDDSGYYVTLGDKKIPFNKKPGQLIQEAAKEALAQHIPEYEKQLKTEAVKELLSLINIELKNKGIDNQIIFNLNNQEFDYKLEKPIMGVYFHGKLNGSVIQSENLNKDNLTVMTYMNKETKDENGLVDKNIFVSKIEDLYNGYITMNDGTTRRHIAVANGRIYWDPAKDSETLIKENEFKKEELKIKEKEAEEYYNKIKNIEFSITEEGQRFIKSGGTFGDIKNTLFLKLYQSGKPLKATNNAHFIKGGASYVEMKKIFEWAISNSYIK